MGKLDHTKVAKQLLKEAAGDLERGAFSAAQVKAQMSTTHAILAGITLVMPDEAAPAEPEFHQFNTGFSAAERV